MRILAWHGYLLTGSGSNVYSANTAKAWREAGHDVLLMCQERDAGDLPFVDAHGDFAADNRSLELHATGAPPAPGRCSVARPAIGSILPVYVFDEYEGFEAKTFVDLTDEELRSYTDRNVAALVTAIDMHRPEVIIVGHEVMGPFIAARAIEQRDVRFSAKLHGSALEYAVKKQERYLRYASDGLNAAHTVIGGSRYMLEEAHSVVPGWEERGRVVNPGCDVDLFRPDDSPSHAAGTVGYVGKFIFSKGVHRLLAALCDAERDRNAVIVGYGDLAEELAALSAALRSGDRDAIEGAAVPFADDAPFMRWVNSLDGDGLTRCSTIDVTFTGRLDHAPLARVLPRFDVLAVPSILAEAFGMVAAEAAACGVFPLVPRHSGIGEAGAAVEEALGRQGWLTFDPDDPIAGLAGAIDRVLSEPAETRRILAGEAVALARERWSWDHVARKLLEAAR